MRRSQTTRGNPSRSTLVATPSPMAPSPMTPTVRRPAVSRCSAMGRRFGTRSPCRSCARPARCPATLGASPPAPLFWTAVQTIVQTHELTATRSRPGPLPRGPSATGSAPRTSPVSECAVLMSRCDDVRAFEATRRRFTARQAEVVAELVRATELRDRGRRLRRADRAERGPPGRCGPGHRLQLLQLQGPSVGRGPVASHAGPPPGRAPGRPPGARAAGRDGPDHGAVHHREPGAGRRLHGGPAQRQPGREAPARPDRRPRSTAGWPPPSGRGWTRWWCGCSRPASRAPC